MKNEVPTKGEKERCEEDGGGDGAKIGSGEKTKLA